MIRENPHRRAVCIGLGTTLITTFSSRSSVSQTTEPMNSKPDTPGMVGAIRKITTKKEDTLLDIARANNLGYVEILAANPGVDPWIPGHGTKIILPTAHLLPSGPRKGLLLNLVDQRLYYFPPHHDIIQTYPIGTGQEAWGTPHGSTKVVRKKLKPTWYVPKSILKAQPDLPPIVRPGPDNPLGGHALYLGWTTYLIHGTNNAWGVGRRVSHGCIRMYPEGIKKLFPQVLIGTQVTIVSEEMKTGWVKGELMMEAHPNLEQNIEIERGEKPTPAQIPEMAYRLIQAAGKKARFINWQTVKRIAKERTGLPVAVLKPAHARNKNSVSETN